MHVRIRNLKKKNYKERHSYTKLYGYILLEKLYNRDITLYNFNKKIYVCLLNYIYNKIKIYIMYIIIFIRFDES